MADWQQLIQSIVIGLIFSYLLAKLISIVTSFKEENLTLTRSHTQDDQLLPESESGRETDGESVRPPAVGSGDLGGSHDVDSVIAEHGSVRNESVAGSDEFDDEDEDSDDDDWEGVESTELDEMFSAATAFVAAAAADRLSTKKVSNDVQLQLYGLYKIATEGPCSAPQPSAIKMTARAKWQAWQKLGAMPPEEAMQTYIDIVSALYPTWLAGASMKSRGGDTGGPSNDSRGPMGPVFSTFVYEEESANDFKMDAIHGFAREGEVDNLLKSIESGVPVNLKDSEGRTPLHWAVDRGHLNMSELLVSKNADINAQDNEGQTPLHYATMCEREAIAEYLVKQNADINVKDNDGNSPYDLCESNWPWMQHSKE
ncbi:hypothetical protein CsatB_002546 [Cannabis sativa]|uniref:ACB domain-containing protein n=1 Tax=Cannabis sativa TaxID=3483 RepID=A0A803PMS6_CANSA|nr:acyl-CoA-binding domain-containing protein 1 isoform X1 [Cannabis sativa]